MSEQSTEQPKSEIANLTSPVPTRDLPPALPAAEEARDTLAALRERLANGAAVLRSDVDMLIHFIDAVLEADEGDDDAEFALFAARAAGGHLGALVDELNRENAALIAALREIADGCMNLRPGHVDYHKNRTKEQIEAIARCALAACEALSGAVPSNKTASAVLPSSSESSEAA